MSDSIGWSISGQFHGTSNFLEGLLDAVALEIRDYHNAFLEGLLDAVALEIRDYHNAASEKSITFHVRTAVHGVF